MILLIVLCSIEQQIVIVMRYKVQRLQNKEIMKQQKKIFRLFFCRINRRNKMLARARRCSDTNKRGRSIVRYKTFVKVKKLSNEYIYLCLRIVELCVVITVRHCLAASMAVSSLANMVWYSKNRYICTGA